MFYYFFFIYSFVAVLKPQWTYATKASWLLVSVPSEAGKKTSIKILKRGRPVTARKKSAIIYVSTSAMWEDKFIDILMIILDHSPLLSSTSAQHILVSSRARLMFHLSRRESTVLVDIKIKMCMTRSKSSMSGSICNVSKHTLLDKKWTSLDGWEDSLCVVFSKHSGTMHINNWIVVVFQGRSV